MDLQMSAMMTQRHAHPTGLRDGSKCLTSGRTILLAGQGLVLCLGIIQCFVELVTPGASTRPLVGMISCMCRQGMPSCLVI